LEIETVLDLGIQMADALDAAHSNSAGARMKHLRDGPIPK
jgi:hypothetical protein